MRLRKYQMSIKLYYFFWSILLSSFLLSSALLAQNILAFPGADGFAKYISGGRGGQIRKVTNLNDSGPGSFREAASFKGPSIIVFEVSGTIDLKSNVTVPDNTTIAGQTAPGEGITFKNYRLTLIEKNNIIIRFIRFRLGDITGRQDNAIFIRDCTDIILDHCSFSWGTDETATNFRNRNLTMQWCLISEGLNKSVHSEGEHGYGAVWGGKNISYHHNLIAHFTQRSPFFDHPGLYSTQEQLDNFRGIVDFRNNVAYNWRDKAASGGAEGKVNFINNYYKSGPGSNSDDYILQGLKTGNNLTFDYGKFYISGNILVGKPNVIADNWVGVRLENPELTNQFLNNLKASTPFSADVYLNTDSAEEAYIKVLDKAGASYFRDPVDQRIINETRTGTFTYKGSNGSTGGIIDSQKDVGGWPVLKSLPAPKDTDRDGMPDVWEAENGLNPNLADHNGYKLSSSYTNIEVYINGLVKHISEPDAVVAPSTPQLESPLNNAVGIAKTTPLKWKSAANAQSYQLQVSKTQDFGTLVTNIENLTSLQYSVPNLEDNTLYFWRVRAKNNSGTSSWSSIWNFKTSQPLSIPEIPKPINPSNGSKDLPNTLLLEWSKVTGAQTYRVQVAKDATFSSMVYDIYNLTGQNIEVKNLEPGSSFAWRVRATNEAGSSNFSEAWTFSTQVNTTTEVISVTGVTLNPTKASIEISKSLQINATVLPSNASNKTVSWISSNPSIASVSPSGLVTGIKSGTALITASSQDGNFTATSEITVATNVPMGISGFTLVNADSDSDIGSISDRNHLDINEIEGLNLNIRVNTNPGLVGSVALSLTGPVNANITENVAPYALFGDNRGNYNGKLLQAGEYTLEAVPYSEPNLSGTKGNPMTVKFTIGEKISAPASPKLSSPLDNSTGLSTTLKLAWNTVTNADSYGIEVSKNPDFSSLVINNNSLKTNEFTVSGLQEDTTYFWRVRATNSSGSSPYSTVWTFRTVKPIMVPAVPTLLSPSNGAKDLSLSPSLQWNAVTGAKTYRVQVSKESNFATLFLDNTSVTTNSLQVNNLEEGLTYYWRVSSTNEAGNSSFSSGWNFTTKPPTNEVIPISGISINPTKADLEVSKTLQLTAAILPSNADNKTVSFTSSNPGIASVSPSGLVTGIKSGAALITATSEDGNFTAISEITVSSPEALGIAQFTLVNADSDTDILELTNGSILDINQVLGLNLNIRVNTNPETVGSVAISISGPVSATITENVAPYALFGDSNGNYNGRILPEGSYSLEAVPYSEPNFGGIKGAPLSIQFSIAEKILAPAIPTLSSPADNTTGLETSINLTWNPVANAETYAIELSKNPDFSSLEVNNNSLKANEFTVSGLQEDTSYYWRVKATNSAGSSPYSSVWTFRTVKPIVVPAVPTLLSPSNGAKDLSLSPSLQWNAVTGAKTYRIQISKESSFGTILIDNSTLTGNTYQANNLEEGVTYYWRVNAANEAGNSIFSSAWSFQTKISLKAPVAPTLINPSDKSTGLATTLKLSWSAVTGAENYTLELSKNADFSSLVINNNSLKTNEFTVSGLQEDTQYYWRVRATNSAGSSPYSTVWTFRTVKPIVAPAVPTLLSPSNGAKDVSTTTSLQWNAVTGAKTYRIQISKESSFGTILIDNATLTGNTFQANNLEEGVTYYWRVNAANEAGISIFSSAWSFQTKISLKAPLAPTLINPSDKSTDLATTLKLSWSAVANAETYTIELSKNPDFSSLVANNNSLKTNEFTVSGLQEDTSYYWRVRATNSAGSSPYSTVWTFKTIKPLLTPEVPTLLSPLDGAKDVSTNTSLQWNAVTDAKTYRIQISKESSFGTILIDNATLTGNTFQVNSLEEGVTYYWRVNAANEAGISNFSSAWSFQTKISIIAPVAPTLINPSDKSTGLATTLKLSWSTVTGAEGYTLELSKNADFSSLINSNSGLTANEFVLSGLEEGSQYYWRVKASNSAGSSPYSQVWSFTTKEKINPPASPTLLGPNHESVSLTGKITFTWTKSEGSMSYGIQISKSQDFTVKQVDITGIQTESIDISDLENGVTYYWRVYASNEGGNSGFSEIWKFETLALPDVPVLLSPSNGKKDLALNSTLHWESTLDAGTYRLQVSKTKDFSQNLIDQSNISETSFILENLEEGMIYYWRVRASNAAGNSAFSSTWEFTTEKPLKAPTAPILLSPSSGTLMNFEEVVLGWKTVIDAERYQVQVSKYSNFSQSIVFDKNTVITDQVTVDGLEPNEVYFWRVRAINIVGTSPYSSVWNFITLPLPDLDSPLLVSPTKGAEVDTASVEFEWETVTDAEFYELQLALDSTFTNQVMRFSQIVETKFRVDSLEIGKSYYWKVIANGKRPSSESEIWKFTIKEDGDLIKANISPVTIKTYPNPFKDKITLEFSRLIEGEVTISIFDNKGISVFENKVSDLMESITLEVPLGLPKGIYLIRIQGFGIFEGKRVVKN
ncbi:fibronectin type III domain-containing protein [Aquiflexum gelatinilyticum]|uniref:fibronectin type III domain-containing protein n=1 Tax=Aquiflexum gelatinilyticum TaxID=2961943 RepID=UPI002168C0EF|nr:fibronectin type III domain-containing protein [Aquiflexum gelatinilyticum]MCS4434334.1 fibronectin type III domain-containing protein [Aquiflexum gelatinilyticum]